MDAIVYTIIYNDQKEVIEILNHTQGTTSDNKIKEKAQEILNQENAKTIYVGNLYIEEYSYSFKGHNTLTIIDNQMSKNRLQSLLRMSIIIFIILEMIIIIISTKITSWIIKPVIETFNKQKQFITDASHELKTPVAVIMANAEALENEPEETKWLENIKSESERMNELISNLLDLAKLENGAQMVVIEGKNTATVTNSTLTASGTGNRGETDQAGIMIYQSMSGDAGEGTGTFTATNSNLSIQANSKYYKTAPMFFITNTDAIINLKNCQLTYGSNTLISNKGTTEWGTTGTNGGNLTLNAENQTLKGNIEIDNISTLKMNLTNSQYTGTINGEQTAKQIDIKIDSNTKIKLTGNSYVTSLEDEDTTYSNIDFNGYTLYVNGTAIN